VTNSAQPINYNQQELKLAYLSLIQNIIGRMSNNVLIMKTTNVTVLTAMLAFSATDKATNFQSWMFFIPWALFTFYHAYFLHKESLFICLYNQAVTNDNFSINNFKIKMEEIDQNQLKDIILIFRDKISFSIFQASLIAIIFFSYSLGVKGV